MFHLIFYRPQIPGNTGAAIRLAACTGATLHVIHPTTIDFDDAKLRRAGLDYHEYARVCHPDSLDGCLESLPQGTRLFAFTGHANTYYHQVSYRPGDALMFGPEDKGLPREVLQDSRITQLLRIPMLEGRGSLNLAVSAALGVYEAWRQIDFPDGV